MTTETIERYEVCPECGHAKKMRIELFGKANIVTCYCKCETDEIERLERERRERIQSAKDRMRYRRSFGSRVLTGDFNDDDGSSPHVSETCRRYAANFDANMKSKVNGIVLFGSPRQGKTFFAEAIARELYRDHNVLMMTAMDLVQSFQFKKGQELEALKHRISNCDLLVIDDFGASRDTEFANEIMFSVIDGRYSSKRPMVITTNLTMEQLSNPDTAEEQRLYGRILERCYPCNVESGRTTARVYGG